MNGRQPLAVAFIIAVLLVLTFWVAHIGWHGFSIEHKLDPVLLATLAVTVFIAYFLQYYFVSKATADGSEKQILLDAIRDIFAMLRELRDVLMACHEASGRVTPSNAKQIKRLFRQIANSLETLETALTLSHCRALRGECKAIQDALFNYKSSATGRNFPISAYDVNSVTDQDRTFRMLNHRLHDLVFKITRWK